jgi:hypothetical protein
VELGCPGRQTAPSSLTAPLVAPVSDCLIDEVRYRGNQPCKGRMSPRHAVPDDGSRDVAGQHVQLHFAANVPQRATENQRRPSAPLSFQRGAQPCSGAASCRQGPDCRRQDADAPARKSTAPYRCCGCSGAGRSCVCWSSIAGPGCRGPRCCGGWPGFCPASKDGHSNRRDTPSPPSERTNAYLQCGDRCSVVKLSRRNDRTVPTG